MKSFNRRTFGKHAGLGLLGASSSGWFPALAANVQAAGTQAPKSCILLWMSGGPSQLETFDPKEGTPNGGPTKSIETRIPGIRIAENLPGIARQMDDLAIIRSMSTKEGDHQRATYFVRTGYLPAGPIQYPAIGAFLGKQLRRPNTDLPAYLSINPFGAISPEAFGPGFLGPAWSPLMVQSEIDRDQKIQFQVRNLQPSNRISSAQVESRLNLLAKMEHSFLTERPDGPGRSHLQAYEQAVRMMKSESVSAFNLDAEDPALRDAYGRNPFGQGCLLARRLVEQGVSFVEVTLSTAGTDVGIGWDTHTDNFAGVKTLCSVLDPAWSTLMTDLRQRGLLEHTLVIWMGEFGRTPTINPNNGRDHWPGSWSAVLAGADIRGGQVYGATSDDGVEIKDRPVTAQNFMATVCQGLGLDPTATNLSPIGRPIPLADHGSEPIKDLLRS